MTKKQHGGDRSKQAAANGKRVGPKPEHGEYPERYHIMLTPTLWRYLQERAAKLGKRSASALIEDEYRRSLDFQQWQREQEKKMSANEMQVWQHATSGERIVVQIDGFERVRAALGPLHYSEIVPIIAEGEIVNSDAELVEALNQEGGAAAWGLWDAGTADLSWSDAVVVVCNQRDILEALDTQAANDLIDRARQVIYRDVADELNRRGATYSSDGLGDWLVSGEWYGDETAAAVADEWMRQD